MEQYCQCPCQIRQVSTSTDTTDSIADSAMQGIKCNVQKMILVTMSDSSVALHVCDEVEFLLPWPEEVCCDYISFSACLDGPNLDIHVDWAGFHSIQTWH